MRILVWGEAKDFLFYDMDSHEKLKSLKDFHATDIWFNSILASKPCTKMKMILLYVVWRFIILIFKNLAFPSGSKTSQAKVKFICDMPYCILPGSTIWKASYENEKDDKFWFCSRMKIVHYSALGIGLYLECLKKLSCSEHDVHFKIPIYSLTHARVIWF